MSPRGRALSRAGSSSYSPATTHTGPRPWVTCVGATAARRACCAPSFWRGCPSGLRRRAGGGRAPTRLGGPEGDQVVGAEAAPPPSGRGHAGGVRDISRPLAAIVAEEAAKRPDKPVEVW